MIKFASKNKKLKLRDLEDELEINKQRTNLLESILKRNNLKIPDEKQKDNKFQNSKKITEKVYTPYQMDNISDSNNINFLNEDEDNNNPMVLLTSDEKIKELTQIIKEKQVIF
jgi:hypothetical protein